VRNNGRGDVIGTVRNSPKALEEQQREVLCAQRIYSRKAAHVSRSRTTYNNPMDARGEGRAFEASRSDAIRQEIPCRKAAITIVPGICGSRMMHDDVMDARGEGEALVASRSDASGRCHAGKLRVFCVSGATHSNVMKARGKKGAFSATRNDADERCLAGEPRIGFCRRSACSTPLWVHTRRCHVSQG
jgi:hypothetical protein